jgi:alkylmercury lyase
MPNNPAIERESSEIKTRNLVDIAKALREAEIPPRFRPDESRLLIQIWRALGDGRAVSPEELKQLASRLHIPFDFAISFVHQVSERDDGGNIVGIVGLSQRNPPHHFKVNGHDLSTWCAWDSLFLPSMLNLTATVESSCPATREKIRLTITPEHVDRYEPSSAVVSIVVPKLTRKGRESVEEVWMTCCHFVHFFARGDVATEWLSARGRKAAILSVEEAHELGCLAFEDLLKYA